MRCVLHVTDSGGLYGAETVILNLATAQIQRGLDPVLVSLGDLPQDKEIEVQAKDRGIRVIPLRFRRGLTISGARGIIECERSLRADIIHCHGYKSDVLVGMMPKNYRQAPVISTLHGWTSTRWFSKIKVYEIADALSLKRLDRVVAVSTVMQDRWLLRFLGIYPVVIPNGVPELQFEKERFSRQYPALAEKCRNKLKILAVGRLSPEKGYDVLIRALSLTMMRSIDFCLVIMGEGEERARLEAMISKEALTDKIHFCGYVKEAYQMMPFFDLFVLPSHTEGLPITVLEAMQAALPIVSTNVGEIEQVLDHGRCGYIIPAGDELALANAIKWVYENREEARQKALLAKERALSEYSVKTMAERYLEQYQDLLGKKRPL